MDLIETITDYLSKRTLSVETCYIASIATNLDLDIVEVRDILHSHEGLFRRLLVDGVKCWTLVKKNSVALIDQHPNIIIFVDCDNMGNDFLDLHALYSKYPDIYIRGHCGPGYHNPRAIQFLDVEGNTTLYKSECTGKDAADVSMMFDALELANRYPKAYIYLLSKDKIFEAAKHELDRRYTDRVFHATHANTIHKLIDELV